LLLDRGKAMNDIVSARRKQRDNSQRKSNKMLQCIKTITLYLFEAQHVSGDTPFIIRSLKLHWEPQVLHTWKVVGRVVAGR